MTDLERARRIMAQVEDACADAYRRGWEEGAEEWRGKFAEQCGKTIAMRERAALTAIGGEHYGFIEQDIADAIRALQTCDLNPASCQQGMPCGDTENCPDPVGCGFEMPPVSEDAYKTAQKFCANRKWGASLIIQIAQLLDDFANNAVDEHIEFYLEMRRKGP